MESRLLPLLRTIEDALDAGTAGDAATRARLHALAVDIVGVITTEMTPNFWRPNRQFAQDAMGASIFRHLLRAGFAANAESEERVERILVFTKANYALFGS